MKNIRLTMMFMLLSMLLNSLGEAWGMEDIRRRYPEESYSTKVLSAPRKKSSAKPRTDLFRDDEILEIMGREEDGDGPILSQEQKSSCGYISAGMIAMDLTGAYDMVRRYIGTSESKDRDLSNHEMVKTYITNILSALHYDHSNLSINSSQHKDHPGDILEHFYRWTQENGSIIMSITDTDGIEGHWIVLDQIVTEKDSEFKVPYAIVRDPYHGWKIKVPVDSLTNRFLDNGDHHQVIEWFITFSKKDPDAPAVTPLEGAGDSGEAQKPVVGSGSPGVDLILQGAPSSPVPSSPVPSSPAPGIAQSQDSAYSPVRSLGSFDDMESDD